MVFVVNRLKCKRGKGKRKDISLEIVVGIIWEMMVVKNKMVVIEVIKSG